MLVLRKEIKIGIGAGLTILGIAGVYGLMASLSSNGAEKKDQSAMVDTGKPSDDKGLGEAIGGLPPSEKEIASLPPSKGADSAKVDPFSESQRTDGNPNNDAVLSALKTGNLGDTKLNNGSHGDTTVVKAPTTPRTESKLVQPTSLDGLTPIEPEKTNNLSASHSKPTDLKSANATSTGTVTGGSKYVIQAGDTFSTISAKIYGTKKYALSLSKANPDVNPSRMKIGKEITVPPKEQVASVGGAIEPDRATLAAPIDASKQYRIAPGDTLSRISQKLYGKSTMWEKIYETNKTVIGPDEAKLKVGMLIDLPSKPVR